MPIDLDQLILTEAPGGVIVASPDGKVVRWTKGAERIFGYNVEQAVGRALLDLIALPGQDSEDASLARLLAADGDCDCEMLRRKKDGALIYVFTSSKAVHDEHGKLVYIISDNKDTTQLKTARDAMLIGAKFRDLLESTPDSIIIANATGSIVLANGEAEQLFGYETGELNGKLIEVLLPSRYQGDHIDHRARYIDQPRRRLMGAGRDLYGLRKDQTEFQVEISLASIHNEAGTFVITAIRDITERKRTETALKNKKAELEKANLAKDRFLTSMSHELRTPMNAILGFAQLLANETLPSTPVQKRTFVKNILTAGEHLLTLINEILDLAKIESDTTPMSLEPVDLSKLCEQVYAMVEPGAARRGIRLVFPEPGKLVAMADHTRLKQVLLNLISNAIKYNRNQGMVLLNIATVEHGRVRLSVQDTGYGLGADQLAALFQPFNRLGQERGSEEGTGIGLVVSKRMTELMGGTMGVSSTLGVGSLFWVELPASAASDAAPLPLSATPPAPYVRRTEAQGPALLLYVEDNPANLALVEEIVGFRSDLILISAPNAEMGVALAQVRLPQVILMDINLPGSSGSVAQQILRDDPRTTHIPVIALTAHAMDGDVRRGIAAGFFRYLTKPICLVAFNDAVDSALALAPESAL